MIGPHAAAAICLYGQSFGFTHADVELLGSEAWLMLDLGEVNERRRRLNELAQRIAALLPPPNP